MRLDQSGRETLIGACVFVAGCAVLVASYAGSKTRLPGYDVIARFDKADGITTSSDVRIAGVRVGKVVAQTLDQRYRAVLTLRVAPTTKLPVDSDAKIESDGLLGGKYITLEPGGDDKVLKPGGEIAITQSSMSLDDVLDMVIGEGEDKLAKEKKGQ